MHWGRLQTAVVDNHYPDGPDGQPLAIVRIRALANPNPEKAVKALRLEVASEDPLLICGLTLFHRRVYSEFFAPALGRHQYGFWPLSVRLR